MPLARWLQLIDARLMELFMLSEYKVVWLIFIIVASYRPEGDVCRRTSAW
jgi:hypothetical protein